MEQIDGKGDEVAGNRAGRGKEGERAPPIRLETMLSNILGI
ncbi:hypothetical protein A8990_10599 [Paenibacillus taihuensis]|uniref:Uncharacterized protein n=1 Tax=Paenibacillus taihuensis TaxID=1156355 RepID=A0A3D9SBX0_9BACL|nr:hypothetical protein A8990_10599 [Paenibacillus taihuensis]